MPQSSIITDSRLDVGKTVIEVDKVALRAGTLQPVVDRAAEVEPSAVAVPTAQGSVAQQAAAPRASASEQADTIEAVVLDAAAVVAHKSQQDARHRTAVAAP